MLEDFGRFVGEKLFEAASSIERKTLVEKMEGRVLELSVHDNGCYIVKKAFEFAPQEQRTKIAHELKGHLLLCAKHKNASHVLRQCLHCLSRNPKDAQFIVDELIDEVRHHLLMRLSFIVTLNHFCDYGRFWNLAHIYTVLE